MRRADQLKPDRGLSIFHKLTHYLFGDIAEDTTRESSPQPEPSQESPAKEAEPTEPRTGGEPLWLQPLSPAMSVATVFRCVQLLSSSVANLPLAFQRRRGGVFTDDPGSSLWYLLRTEPNPTSSAFMMMRSAVQEMLLSGNAYIVPVYNPVTMDTDRLVLCARGTVAHDTDRDLYTVNDQTNHVAGTYGARDIIHLMGIPDRTGKRGLSVLRYAAHCTAIASSGDRETLSRFISGGNMRGIVSGTKEVRGFGELQDRELTKTAVSLDERFQAGERIVGLPSVVDFKQLSLSSTDMQFLESRRFTVREICRFFGVHPSFVFDDTSNNYKSAEQASAAFMEYTLNPLLLSIEQEFNRKLIGRARAGRVRIIFDRRGVYSCDLLSRVAYQTQTIGAGLYTVNEWRAIEDRPPVEGGDKVMVSANLRTLDELTQPPTTTPPTKKDAKERE